MVFILVEARRVSSIGGGGSSILFTRHCFSYSASEPAFPELHFLLRFW